MKFSLPLILAVLYCTIDYSRKCRVLSFRSSQQYPTPSHNFSPTTLKSQTLGSLSDSHIPSPNVTVTPKDDLLNQTKDWILSKDEKDLTSSAHFDGNFKELFPYRRSSRAGVLLKVDDASIWLGDRILLDNVSFSVNTGECVGIIGNNGVGKSSLFDSIYDRLSGAHSSKQSMSVMMDVSFNLDSDDTTKHTSNTGNLYAFLSQVMRSGPLKPDEFLEEYAKFGDTTASNTAMCNLSGVGYMRQNYTLDLDQDALVSDLISRVFESYSTCNNVIAHIESNLEYFNSLMLHECCDKLAGDILSLYNKEGKLIRQRFKDIKVLIKRLVSIFGMEGVINSTVKSLSGGFKMRLYLFLLLLHSPNLLLLDEPTNNLDTTTVKFLIDVLNYLMKNTNLSVLVVSHDTSLLNSICTSILQITGDGNINPYRGNFDDFVMKGTSEKNIRNATIERLRKNITILTKEIEEIKSNRKGSLKALKVTISQKEELLEKYNSELEELVGSPLSKYTKTYNRVLFNDTGTFNAIFQKMLNKNALLNTGQMINTMGPLFKLINVTLETDTGKRVFENLDLTVYPSERTVLLGDNGIGKTTLMKLLFKSQTTFRNNPVLNQISRFDKRLLHEAVNNNHISRGSETWKLFERINQANREMTNAQDSLFNLDDIEYRILVKEPFNFRLVEGLMSVNDAKVSYYSQNCSNILNYHKTVYNLMRDYVEDDVDQQLLAEYMGCFHLKDYMDSQVSDLSFGERSRLLLSLLLVNKAHFLLLDEPTNHLDLFMKKVLKLIVNTIYKGGFMLATHDLDFLRDLDNIHSFIYIHSKDQIFRFNHNFGNVYLDFKTQSPDVTRSEVLEFLTSCSKDPNLAKLPQTFFNEELANAPRVFKRKKKSQPAPNSTSKPKIKNIKRWN